MSRRPLAHPIARMVKAQDRMAPGGRVWSESPVPARHTPRVPMAGEDVAPPSCECWVVPGSALPATYVPIRALNEEFFQTCLPEYATFYGNDTVEGTGAGSSWSATMGQGTHVTVTTAETPPGVYVQMFVGDTQDKLDLYVYATDFVTQYTITAATVCPLGVTL